MSARSQLPPSEEIVATLLATADQEQGPGRNELLTGIRGYLLVVVQRKFADLRGEAEDVVQEVLTKVASPRVLTTLEDWACFWPWTFGILGHTVGDFRRKARYNPSRLTASANPDAEAEERVSDLIAGYTESAEASAGRRETLKSVLQIIATCPPARLRWVLGLSEKEICARTGLSRDQVAQKLKRIRAKIRKLLDGNGEDQRSDTNAKERATKVRR